MQTITEQRETNRARLNAWYRKALPFLLKDSTTWARLRANGNAIKRQWCKYMEQRQAGKSSHANQIFSRPHMSPSLKKWSKQHDTEPAQNHAEGNMT